MKSSFFIGALTLTIAGAASAASLEDHVRVVTASNTANNELLVYDASGSLLNQIRTGGKGGAAGNAGGIAQNHDRLAVVNFGSNSVSVFSKEFDAGLRLEKVIDVGASPVSVAFGHDHLYVLTVTGVESHAISGIGVGSEPDGQTGLVVADGSAAQIGVLPGELIFTEKSNGIETAKLNDRGAIAGKATPVANYPANAVEPLGLITRGNEAYVTIAQADDVTLVRNDAVVTVGSTGSQKAPCWLAFDGAFLFSSNTGSNTVSRFAVYGKNVVLDAPVAATLNGHSLDIAQVGGLLSVVDNGGTASHVSMFHVDEDGNLSLQGVATISTTTTNGIAILREDRDFGF